MKISDGLAVLSHLINFAIVVYFSSFLLNKNLLTLHDSAISFFGLFVSLIANVYSAVEKYKGE